MPQDRLERVGFWFDSLESLPESEPPRPLPAQVDIAIVGGGFTGFWTAYYLKRLEPSLDIAVIEAVTVGFGASGRNGGWCTSMSSGLEEMLEHPRRREAGVHLLRAVDSAIPSAYLSTVRATSRIACSRISNISSICGSVMTSGGEKTHMFTSGRTISPSSSHRSSTR